MATSGNSLASYKTVLVRVSPHSKAVSELLFLTKQWSLPLRPENEVEDNFSKEGNQALLKVPTLKKGSRAGKQTKKTGHETVELGKVSIRLAIVFFWFPPLPLRAT